jgi:hypothetical protein
VNETYGPGLCPSPSGRSRGVELIAWDGGGDERKVRYCRMTCILVVVSWCRILGRMLWECTDPS